MAGRQCKQPVEEAEHAASGVPTGFPFHDGDVTWTYKRFHLVDKPNKVILLGLETMTGDVNAVLRTKVTKDEVRKLKNSVMGMFTLLDDFTTRNGKMLHYVVCHRVLPTPDFDPTCLFFKIGDTVLRFSRSEYALVSGLKFSPACFKPYVKHDLPPKSTFVRLFGADEQVKLKDVHEAYTNDSFIVNGKKVRPTTEDWIKLSKILLCLGYVLGFDAGKRKIPTWLWVLLEDEKEWEEFPWGSISYQLLVQTINKVTCIARRSRKISYTFKGNTLLDPNQNEKKMIQTTDSQWFGLNFGSVGFCYTLEKCSKIFQHFSSQAKKHKLK